MSNLPIAKVEREVVVFLTLSEYQARYLQGLTQNYLGGNPRDESDQNARARESIFTALKDALEADK